MFQPLVDRIGLGSLVPVEFFGTRKLEFLPSGSSLQRFEVGYVTAVLQPFVRSTCVEGNSSAKVKLWLKQKKFDSILISPQQLPSG